MGGQAVFTAPSHSRGRPATVLRVPVAPPFAWTTARAGYGEPVTEAAGLRDVLDDLDRRHETHLDELAAYVAIPSVSAEGRGVREAAAHIRGRAEAWGLSSALLETGGQPAVVLRGPEVPGAPRVLIYGHYDVQPTGPADAWRTDPFTATIHNGRIWGRGTGDNKGQHLSHLLAMEAWLRLSGSLPCNVTVLLDGEEEVGSPNLAAFVDAHRDLLACDLVVWSDGPLHQTGRATVNFGVRGIVQFELVARAANDDLHSGNWGGIARNPAWELVHLLGTMKDRHGRITVDGLTDDVTPITDAERRALAAMPIDTAELDALGIGAWDEPADRGFYERLCAYPTLTISRLEAGGTGKPRTIIPAEARAVCDVRLVDAMTAAGTYARIAEHVRRHAPGVTCTQRGSMEPSRTDLDSPYAEPIRRALRLVHGEEPYLVPALGGSLPDYVFTKVLGVPSIGVPFANADEANHAPNENLTLDCYRAAPKVSAALLAELGAGTTEDGT
jgi:acetylornithine deacetylase/succinyl-diaminopimelate desuccinylase-like protein